MGILFTASLTSYQDLSLYWGNQGPIKSFHLATHSFSCLENPMDRGAWRATIHSVEESWIQMKGLSTLLLT